MELMFIIDEFCWSTIPEPDQTSKFMAQVTLGQVKAWGRQAQHVYKAKIHIKYEADGQFTAIQLYRRGLHAALTLMFRQHDVMLVHHDDRRADLGPKFTVFEYSDPTFLDRLEGATKSYLV